MKKMIDNEKAMKLLQVADKVDFESDEMVIEGKLDVNGKITANNGVEVAEGTILTVPSASNVFIKDESTNLDQELYAKQDKLVSGTNIKTINGNSVLGSGNIEIEGKNYSAGDNIEITTENKIRVISEPRLTDIHVSTDQPDLQGTTAFYVAGVLPNQYNVQLKFGETDALHLLLLHDRMWFTYAAAIIEGAYQITGTQLSYVDAAAAIVSYWSALSATQRRALLYKLIFTFTAFGAKIVYGEYTAEAYGTAPQGSTIIVLDKDNMSAYGFNTSGTFTDFIGTMSGLTLTAITYQCIGKTFQQS